MVDFKKLLNENKMKKTTNPKANKGGIFGDVQGEKFGGSANYLQMQENEVIHGMVHIRVDPKVELDKANDPVDLHVAMHPETGEEIRMPASAVFRINAEKAKLKAGDVYSIARLPSVKKKNGKGKGKPMDVYSILVTKRLAKVKKTS